MEKVDLSKAQAGYTAHFRCGGSAVIKSINPSLRIDGNGYYITYEDAFDSFGTHHYYNGFLHPFDFQENSDEVKKCPFDIIEVTP